MASSTFPNLSLTHKQTLASALIKRTRAATRSNGSSWYLHYYTKEPSRPQPAGWDNSTNIFSDQLQREFRRVMCHQLTESTWFLQSVPKTEYPMWVDFNGTLWRKQQPLILWQHIILLRRTGFTPNLWLKHIQRQHQLR